MRGSGKADIYAMLAAPLDHTKSPGMFNALFESQGYDALMVPVTCDPQDLPVFWAGLKAMSNLKGIIVSVPFKTAVYDLCDHANPRAERVVTVNSVVREADGSFRADNFDGLGFIEAMKREGHTVAGERVLQVGAGGAGASIAYCLAEAGAASVVIFDIDGDRADALAQRVRAAFPQCDVSTGPANPRGRSLVINASSAGLRPDDPYPIDVDGLSVEMTVADIIMDPHETPLLTRAREIGCTVQYGLPMMECQFEAMADFLKVRDGRRRDE
jgi:shikimate dehydrogenase